ncbi:Transposon Tn21 resolvase [Paraburkholderia kururiensis]|uniref:recombinase family protein n=1 Tax=Paraburkholderia kururiensis TaxID=984307 RepID=UPI0039A5BA18
MTGQRVAYKRVSTVDQSTERQLDGMTFDREFEDKASGKDTNRPALAAMLEHVRAGDTIVVHSIDRLARSTSDLLAMVKCLNQKGVSVEFVKENLTFRADKANARDELMMTMLAAFAKFERDMIGERQREGIAIAKAAGKYTGSAGRSKLSDADKAAIRARAAAGEKKAGLAREFSISRETLYQVLNA